jgi:hypothetical protein
MLHRALNLDGFMEIHTAEPLLPKASPFEIEIPIAKL